jgi:hypothetical protein
MATKKILMEKPAVFRSAHSKIGSLKVSSESEVKATFI